MHHAQQHSRPDELDDDGDSSGAYRTKSLHSTLPVLVEVGIRDDVVSFRHLLSSLDWSLCLSSWCLLVLEMRDAITLMVWER